MSELGPDPFEEARRKKGHLRCPFQGEDIPMILRHRDVQAAAKDWKTYSSDAPFRVPIPSEEEMRPVRQLPIETDPPEHTDYRKIVEPFFKRPRDKEVAAAVRQVIDRHVGAACTSRDPVEVIRGFALPIQSEALALLLNEKPEEAEIWTAWGVHVFHDGEGGQSTAEKGTVLDRYLEERFDRAHEEPGEDFFSALTQATYQDRSLTREEMIGFANLTFAGGRDTVIQSIARVVAHLAENPEAIPFLREDSKRTALAAEEIFRVTTPLTHIGRVVHEETEVHGAPTPAQGRVSLCWASANRDEEVFDAPDEVRLDRRPNPHIAFGAGDHFCLGAAHARLVIRALFEALAEATDQLKIVEQIDHIEEEATYTRVNGFDRLLVEFSSRA